ncbi:amidase [Polynucleobacter sinensis]|uniref:amidase n=1 Tax=Polynucleobacter sinensis TaxID=1743157 RepID=UPI000782A609|nr:amidase [Polynucleobacter sinensis]
MPINISYIQSQLNAGKISTHQLIKNCLDKIQDINGQGAKAFLAIDEKGALATADAQDILRNASLPVGPLAGVTISIKDLFDVLDQVTGSGSRVLHSNPPATKDAHVVAKLREAGSILIGRTNMTEFAYSGLGVNPHFGTPLNPFERDVQRIPGGSTSGGAVSVSDEMVSVALGSDTGGSCRIPAALCGLVGYKSTASRYSMEGVLPLSGSLDSIGVIASSVDCCQRVDVVMSGRNYAINHNIEARDIRMGVLRNIVLSGMDEYVEHAYLEALDILISAGIHANKVDSNAVSQVIDLQGQPKIVSAEAFAGLEKVISISLPEIDPRVSSRVLKGREVSSAAYIQTVSMRAKLISMWEDEFASDDIWIMPTVPVIAPKLIDLNDDDEYFRLNGLLLRNPGIFNFLDGCAISIPCQTLNSAPVGLMLVAPGGNDEKLLSIASLFEDIFSKFMDRPSR